MKIKISYKFNENSDFEILNPHCLGIVEQLGDSDDPIELRFDDVAKVKNHLAKITASFHATGNDLSVIYMALNWYEKLSALLDHYQENNELPCTTVCGEGKFKGNFIRIELE